MNRLDKSLDKLINEFSIDNLILFLRKVLEGKNFKPDNEELDYLFSDDIYNKYESVVKIGEATIDNDDLIIIASKTNEPLTERTGKKNQYEIAKKILKHEVKDASFFVFYDDEGNFRFSFIKANYLGTKRDFTDFKRYTYYVTPKQSNRTFIKQVGGCNFNSLDEIVQAFSVEPLNKQFYQDIAKSFYSLIGGKVKIGSQNVDFDTSLELPSISVETNRKVYQEFAVRLIGRTIFCWFLKSKKSENSIPLVPDSWLSHKKVVEVNNDQHNYYHTILEKLFFLVLNKKPEDRKNYSLPPDHELIPFLNGGLFEAQPDDFFPVNSQGIHQISYNLKIPNQWFIELFKTLEQYNFTIDENSIYDAEVSIDPEMLGTIFENLLAEIDPDTKKSARKATGSFYTPREIVDYMVEQSLVQYLKTKLHTDKEEQLLELFKEGGENKFEPNETKNILTALSEVKILDPACGSGAFPMGALHKIITALHKLDPDASWWKEKQIANVPNALAKQILREKLDGESADYIRKLGVIQNSIYGVDIQPIASEISKLRSFLSLVIDETIIDDAENRGIQALPNLEFKFVTANTLIGLDENKSTEMGNIGSVFLDFGQTDELQEKLKDIRNRYLQAYGEEKIKLKKDFERIQTQILKQDIANGAQSKRAQQLASWKPFSNESNAWFDPYWMFGVEKFDIVIGNPPYVFTRDVDFGINFKEYVKKEYFSLISLPEKSRARQAGKINLFAIFLLKGKNLITKEGNLIYILPNNLLRGTVYDVIRYDLLQNNEIISIVDLGEGVFSKVTASTILLQIGNKRKNTTKINVLTDVISLTEKNYQQKEILQDVFLNNTSYTFNIMLNDTELRLSNKIKSGKKEFGDFCIDIIEGIVAHKHLIKERKEKNCYDLIEGKDIKRFTIKNSSNFIIWNTDEIHRTRPKYLWEKRKKIVMQRISGGTMPLVAAIDYDKRKSFASTNNIVLKDDLDEYYEFFTCLLNSKLLNWYYANNFSNKSNLTVNISKTFLETLPIKLIDKSQIQFFNELHNKLVNTYGTRSFENNYLLLNIVIYKLYNLTYPEIKIIDPEFPLTQEEYDNYQIDE